MALFCPSTGLKIYTRPEWTNFKASDTFTANFYTIGNSVIYSRPLGVADLDGVQKSTALNVKVAQHVTGGAGAYIQIEDYAATEGSTQAARKFFTNHMISIERDFSLIFCNLSYALSIAVKIGTRFNTTLKKVHIAKHYEDAIKLAAAISDQQNYDQAAFGLKRPVRTGKSQISMEPVEILTDPEWDINATGYTNQTTIIDNCILHSIAEGYLEASHIPLIEQMRNRCQQAIPKNKNLDYLIADVTRMKGGNRLARKRYFQSLKRWNQEFPFRMLILNGANAFLQTAARLARPFMPFQIEFARDIDHAFELVRVDRYSGSVSSATLADKVSVPDPNRRNVEQLLGYIAGIDWSEKGTPKEFQVDEEHPFYILFQSIRLIKEELDDLFAERRQAIDTLKKSEEKYRELFEKGSDWICLHDLNGNIIESNLSFKEELGRHGEDGVLPNLRELIPNRYHDQYEEYIERVVRNGHDKGIVEVVGLVGDSIILEYNNILLTDTSDGPLLVKGTARNVTKEITAARTRKKLEDKLRQSKKMEAIGTLAGGIAHDFNNILMPLVGHTEMMLEDAPPDSPLRKPLNKVMTASLRARDLVKQILTFSRKGRQETKPLKIQHILKEVLLLVRSTFPATIEIVREIDKNCGMVMADPAQIHQIIMNLITNAYHAMQDKGGTLKIVLEEIELAQENMLDRSLLSGKHVCLTIADTGIGMDFETAEKIFEPYFTTKDQGKGTGLGLAVVHGIVKSYGGSIDVASEKGKGTCVKVFFPQIKSEEQYGGEAQPAVAKTGNEKILLVDDEPAILSIMEEMLSRLGYSVTAHNRSLEALRLFADRPGYFDLVITDLTMPEITGDQLCVALRKKRPDIPIILCTGYSERVQDAQNSLAGVSRILMKPIIRDELANAVRNLLDK